MKLTPKGVAIATLFSIGLPAWLPGTAFAVEEVHSQTGSDPAVFEAAAAASSWEQVFYDCGTKDWSEKWFLDGEIGTVENTPDGMELRAGPRFLENAHHMVLWTKESFAGDLRIEFEYTRHDFAQRCVNILFIQATGSGPEPFVEDIYSWRELRSTPAMSMYFNHMNAYHISFAAFGNTWEDSASYIRGRRYVGQNFGLRGTEMTPDYFPPASLFAPGVPHQITVIKRERDIYLRIERDELVYHAHLHNAKHPPVLEGRIGLRHMFTRSGLYRNFSISTATPE